MPEDSDDMPDTLPSFSAPIISRTEKEIPREIIRRSENVQVLISLAVLTLAGTLFVQQKVSFPLLESIADVSIVKWSFRVFVYLTVIFVVMKLITSTFYPGSESKKLILIHEWIEPFFYVGISMLLPLIIVIAVIRQRIPARFETILIATLFIIGLASVIYFAYLFANRTSTAYEESRGIQIEELKAQILWSLVKRHGWGRGIPEEQILQGLPSRDISQSREAINELIKNPEVPIIKTANRIVIEKDGISDLAYILRNSGYSELEIESSLKHFTGFEDE